jgi:hypothetical protein
MDRSITLAVDVNADPTRVTEILTTTEDRLQRYVATGTPQPFVPAASE